MLLRVLYCSASVLFLLTMTFTASTVFPQHGVRRFVGLFTFFSSILLSTFFRNSTLYGYLPFPYFQHFLLRVQRSGDACPRDHLRMAGEIVVYPTFAFIWLGALTVVCLIIAFATFTKKGCDEYLNEGNGLCQRKKFAVRTRVPVRETRRGG